ncbi:MAG: site-specific DNA-methyltransferase [Bacteroidia bacterium]|nr:site-specific DNA-methyltransferase [Bacteroidia bacterium]
MSQDINQLILGDNLEILKSLDSDTIDLIYLDPPFFSNRSYEVIWGDSGEVRSFEDRFSGGIDHYISWLKERVIEMHRILKPTGVIFLHCDWHANSYIRTEILDKIFSYNNFRNEIIWKRKTGKGETNHKSSVFGVSTDTIFFYSKTNNYIFNSQFTFDADGFQEYLDSNFNLVDDTVRKYRSADLGSPSPRPNLTYDYKGYSPPKNGWAIEKSKMELWDEEGRLLFPIDKKGRIRRKVFLDEVKGKPVQNIWDDINMVSGSSKEKIGYPTQKPEALLKRIIETGTNENYLVLDPFVGGGTTIAVADKLNRKWIGIDQSVQAVKVTEFRLNQQQDLFSKPFIVQLHKYDYDTLRYKDAFEFENFIVTAFGGRPNTKQRGDLGLDGKTLDNVPIQIKRSDNIGRNVIDNFHSAIQRNDKKLYEKNKTEIKPVGFIIAFSFGKGAIEEVARLKNKENIVIKLVLVEEIIPIAKKPTISVILADKGKDKKGLHEIEFTAKGNSEAGVEFFSWDFDYKDEKFKAEILLDKSGKQTYKFKAGSHQIAVKVVDNDGLESTEIIKLKVNGVLERQ